MKDDKSIEQKIHEAILDDHQIKKLQREKVKIMSRSIPYKKLHDTELLDAMNENDAYNLKQLDNLITFRENQIKRFYSR